MSFSNVVSWWEEWQLRILVLGSLAIQLFLAAFSPFRKWTGLGYLHRLTIWVSYLGGDALAIYALATLFNRQKKLQYSSSSSSVKNDGSHDLEVLWAPILLMHLGGRLTISAYNIEDNELWLRHVGVAVSQVTVTVYVFWTSWSPTADKRLFAAAIVLLILGIFRCFDKPIALKRASFNNLANYFSPAPRTEIGTNREVELEQYIQQARGLYYVRSCSNDGNQHQQDQDPSSASASAVTSSSSSKEAEAAESEKESRRSRRKLSEPDKLFVDYADAYSDRLEKLKSLRLLVNNPETAFKALRAGLSKTFNLVYTKMWRFKGGTQTIGDYLSLFLWEITMTLPVASIVLFHISHKQAYRGSDVKVTYLLLYITYFSEIISAPVRLAYVSFQRLSRPSPSTFRDCRSCRTLFLDVSAMLLNLVGLPSFPFIFVEQHSLIGAVADKKRWRFTAGIAHCFRCREFLLQRWFGRGNFYCKGGDITRMVVTHAEEAWMNCIEDVESYWKLSDSRGHWTLERNGCQQIQVLRDSLEKPLDESVILWHLATDFCFHCKGTSADPTPAILCTKISNYMMYLLCANTEMLLPGSRTSLFEGACKELDGILILRGPGAFEHLTEKVISEAANSEKGVVHDAWLLAQALMQLPPGGGGADGDDGKKMWTVIKGVWMEMLCFSAGRCRGYLHAKNLAYGGEFITFVALLMSNAGLETFAERQQRMRLQLPKEERLKRGDMVIIEQATSNQAAGEENAATATATPWSSSSKGACTTASGSAREVVVLLN